MFIPPTLGEVCNITPAERAKVTIERTLLIHMTVQKVHQYCYVQFKLYSETKPAEI